MHSRSSDRVGAIPGPRARTAPGRCVPPNHGQTQGRSQPGRSVRSWSPAARRKVAALSPPDAAPAERHLTAFPCAETGGSVGVNADGARVCSPAVGFSFCTFHTSGASNTDEAQPLSHRGARGPRTAHGWHTAAPVAEACTAGPGALGGGGGKGGIVGWGQPHPSESHASLPQVTPQPLPPSPARLLYTHRLAHPTGPATCPALGTRRDPQEGGRAGPRLPSKGR